MRTPLLLAVCVAICCSSQSALAQERASDHDLKCLLTMGALGGNEKNRIPALMGVYYFAGRIKASDPGLSLPDALKTLAPKMRPDDFKAAAKECGAEVNQTTMNLQEAQADLKPAAPAKPGQHP